jgi:pyruvate/2-oxoglutarate dehydrogenase complex dihydrolipoamide dehydrogenase (E3) component
VTSKPNAAAILARRDSFTNDWHDFGQVDCLRNAGIDLVRTRRLTRDRHVSVEANDGTTRELTARHAVAVCTGTRAAILPIPGLKEARPWSSSEATAAKEAPRRLVILGGGVIACDGDRLAATRPGGDNVLRGQSLLPRYEECACEAVAKVITNTSAKAVERLSDGSLRVSLSTGECIDAGPDSCRDRSRTENGRPGLESIGLKSGSWLEVDETMRVNGITDGWLYAVGDVNHRALLTHMGKSGSRLRRSYQRARQRAIRFTRRWKMEPCRRERGPLRRAAGRLHGPGGRCRGMSADEARKHGLDVRRGL